MEDYFELITEFAHAWRRLTIRRLRLLTQGKGYEFCISTVLNHLHAMNMRRKTTRLKPIMTERVRMRRLRFALSLVACRPFSWTRGLDQIEITNNIVLINN